MPYKKTEWSQGSVVTVSKMDKIETELQRTREQLDSVFGIPTEDFDAEPGDLNSRINNMIIISEDQPTEESGLLDNKLWIDLNKESEIITVPTQEEFEIELGKKMNGFELNYQGHDFNTNTLTTALPMNNFKVYGQTYTTEQTIFNPRNYDQHLYVFNTAISTNSDSAGTAWVYNASGKRIGYRFDTPVELQALLTDADAGQLIANDVVVLSTPLMVYNTQLSAQGFNCRLGYSSDCTTITLIIKNNAFAGLSQDSCIAAYQEFLQQLGPLHIWYNSSAYHLQTQFYTTFSINTPQGTYTYGTTTLGPGLFEGDILDYSRGCIISKHKYYVLGKDSETFETGEDESYLISKQAYDSANYTQGFSTYYPFLQESGNIHLTIDNNYHIRLYGMPLQPLVLAEVNEQFHTAYTNRLPVKILLETIDTEETFVQISEPFLSFPPNANCSDNISFSYFSTEANTLAQQMSNFVSAIQHIEQLKKDQHTTYFISNTGNDDNDGYSLDTAKASINAAIQAGAKTIFLDSGIYTEQIDLSTSKYNQIELYHYNPTRQKDKKVLFVPENYIIPDFSQRTDVSNKTVYFTTITDATLQNALSSNAYIWLFHENTIDTTALIDNADETSVTQQYIERHSLQKGQTSRRLERRLQRINSLLDDGVFMSDKLTQFSQQEGVWFYDSDTHQLYISSINPIDDEHPICGSYKINQNLFKLNETQRNNFTIIANDIDVKYERFNLDYTVNSHITNCTCKNVYGTNCFSYNGAEQVTLEKCEASCAYYSNNHGDGISATGLSSNGTMLNASSAHLIDCWSHDNLDDGFSDHIGCSSVIDGGLFEYNWYGGGITPSHGSLCICRNAIAQKNGQAGFLYIGRAGLTDQQEGAQFECSNCISNDNGYWGGGEKGATNQMIGGFVVDGTADGRDLNTLSDAYVTARFNSCVAVNEIRGFAAVRQGNAIVTNCYASNCQNDTYIGAATSTDKAGSLDVVELTPLYDPNKSIDKILEDIAGIQTDLSDTKADLNDVSNNVQQINSVLSKDTGTETPTSLLDKQKEYVGNYTNKTTNNTGGAWINLEDSINAETGQVTSYYRFVLIPVTPGQQITLSRPSGERSGLYKFFNDKPTFNEQNQPQDSATNLIISEENGIGLNKREYTTERTITVPTVKNSNNVTINPVYLFLMTHYNTSDVRPNKLIINGVDYLVVPEAGISPLQEYITPEVQNIMQPAINTLTNKTNELTTQNENRIKEVENLQKEVSGIISPLIQQYEVHDGYINTSSTIKRWVIPNSSSADLEALKAYQYIIIPVQTNDEIQIQRYDLDSIYNRSLYLLISEYDTPVNDQVVTPAIDGQTIQEAGTTIQSFIVPKDCYLYILVKRDNVDRTPTLLTINGIDYIHPVSDLNYHISWNEQMQPPYEYCLENILCIGDSLTMGSYPEYNTPPGWSGNSHFIQQNYPYFLSRMLNTNVTNAGFSGFSAYDWWHGAVEGSWERPQYTYSDYDVVTIWLGTNKGLDNSYQTSADETIYPLETPYDAENNTGFYIENPSVTYPDTRPENERIPLKWNTNTQVGCYCQIIEEILHDNPKALIILLTTFAGNSSNGTATAPRHLPKEDTARIYEIANHFHLPVVSLSDLQYSIHPEFHGEPTEVTEKVNGQMVTTVKTDKTHLKKTGHLFVANRIIKTIREWIAEDVTRGEFGIHRRNDIDSIPRA